ncbi:MAG: patatin-like phospholipase family protein [Bacillota bacterium]
MNIGLALSGGAARGIAHIGVLKYLEEINVRPVRIAGTSAGSIVASFYCAGISVDEIERIVLGLTWKDVIKLGLPRMGLINSELLEKFVEFHIGKVTFAQLKIPLTVNAVDLISGEEVIMESGPVATAVQASCAIPGIFTPVCLGNRLLVDGGLLNNVPVKLLHDKGVDYLIAVDINAQRPLLDDPQNIFDVLAQSFYIVQKSRDLLSREYADLIVEPVLGDIAFWDITRAEELMQRGYEACRASMAAAKTAKKRNRFISWLGFR